jgi:alkaline phosphatase
MSNSRSGRRRARRTHLAADGGQLLGLLSNEEMSQQRPESQGDEFDPAVEDRISGEDGPFAVAGSEKQFVMDWTTSGHTGAPTPVTAEGVHSDQLVGSYPNTHLHEVVQGVLFGES